MILLIYTLHIHLLLLPTDLNSIMILLIFIPILFSSPSIKYLNSIMILLIWSCRWKIMQCIWSFKFHYDSINFFSTMIIPLYIVNLNSIMILLILKLDLDSCFILNQFKFHYDSINFAICTVLLLCDHWFKFHYDSINFFKKKSDSILCTVI